MERVKLTVFKEDGEWIPITFLPKPLQSIPEHHPYTHRVEISPSSRATCRQCSKKVEKGSVRIGTPIKWRGGTYGYISTWSHVECSRLVDEYPEYIQQAPAGGPNDTAAPLIDFDCNVNVFGWSKLTAEQKDTISREFLSTRAPQHLLSEETIKLEKRHHNPLLAPPYGFKGELLPHQLDGVGWLLQCEGNGMNNDVWGTINKDQFQFLQTLQSPEFGGIRTKLLDSHTALVAAQDLPGSSNPTPQQQPQEQTPKDDDVDFNNILDDLLMGISGSDFTQTAQSTPSNSNQDASSLSSLIPTTSDAIYTYWPQNNNNNNNNNNNPPQQPQSLLPLHHLPLKNPTSTQLTKYFDPTSSLARVPVSLFDTTHGGVNLQPDHPQRGGILADEMGLGKTIQVIALVLEQKYRWYRICDYFNTCKLPAIKSIDEQCNTDLNQQRRISTSINRDFYNPFALDAAYLLPQHFPVYFHSYYRHYYDEFEKFCLDNSIVYDVANMVGWVSQNASPAKAKKSPPKSRPKGKKSDTMKDGDNIDDNRNYDDDDDNDDGGAKKPTPARRTRTKKTDDGNEDATVTTPNPSAKTSSRGRRKIILETSEDEKPVDFFSPAPTSTSVLLQPSTTSPQQQNPNAQPSQIASAQPVKPQIKSYIDSDDDDGDDDHESEDESQFSQSHIAITSTPKTSRHFQPSTSTPSQPPRTRTRQSFSTSQPKIQNQSQNSDRDLSSQNTQTPYPPPPIPPPVPPTASSPTELTPSLTQSSGHPLAHDLRSSKPFGIQRWSIYPHPGAGPTLIICPTNCVIQWKNEFQHFADCEVDSALSTLTTDSELTNVYYHHSVLQQNVMPGTVGFTFTDPTTIQTVLNTVNPHNHPDDSQIESSPTKDKPKNPTKAAKSKSQKSKTAQQERPGSPGLVNIAPPYQQVSKVAPVFTMPHKLKLLIYYGQDRTIIGAHLHRYDIVITSYNVISQDYKAYQDCITLLRQQLSPDDVSSETTTSKGNAKSNSSKTAKKSTKSNNKGSESDFIASETESGDSSSDTDGSDSAIEIRPPRNRRTSRQPSDIIDSAIKLSLNSIKPAKMPTAKSRKEPKTGNSKSGKKQENDSDDAFEGMVFGDNLADARTTGVKKNRKKQNKNASEDGDQTPKPTPRRVRPPKTTMHKPITPSIILTSDSDPPPPKPPRSRSKRPSKRVQSSESELFSDSGSSSSDDDSEIELLSSSEDDRRSKKPVRGRKTPSKGPLPPPPPPPSTSRTRRSTQTYSDSESDSDASQSDSHQVSSKSTKLTKQAKAPLFVPGIQKAMLTLGILAGDGKDMNNDDLEDDQTIQTLDQTATPLTASDLKTIQKKSGKKRKQVKRGQDDGSDAAGDKVVKKTRNSKKAMKLVELALTTNDVDNTRRDNEEQVRNNRVESTKQRVDRPTARATYIDSEDELSDVEVKLPAPTSSPPPTSTTQTSIAPNLTPFPNQPTPQSSIPRPSNEAMLQTHENFILQQIAPLHSLHWARLVCDEAHRLKNRSSLVYHTIMAINSDTRLLLTGTPLQNNTADLHSLLSVIRSHHAFYICQQQGCFCQFVHWRVDPTSYYCSQCQHGGSTHLSQFSINIANPLQRYGLKGRQGQVAHLLLEQAITDTVLRRTKQLIQEQLSLPPVHFIKYVIHPTKREQLQYKRIFTNTSSHVQDLAESGQFLSNYAHIFSLLNKLRLFCNFGGFVQSTEISQKVESLEEVLEHDTMMGIDIDATPMEIPTMTTTNTDSTEPIGGVNGLALQNYVVHFDPDNPNPASTPSIPTNLSVTDQAARFNPFTIQGCNNIMQTHEVIDFYPPADNALNQYIISTETDAGNKTYNVFNIPQSIRIYNNITLQQALTAVVKSTSSLNIPSMQPSGKLYAICSAAYQIFQSNPINKIIIFSQYNSMLNLLYKCLAVGLNIPTALYSSSLSILHRAQLLTKFAQPVVASFEDDENISATNSNNSSMDDSPNIHASSRQSKTAPLQQAPRILLMSIKSSSEGLNLQCANHIFLVDNWWNSSVELQAISRIHRIGNKFPRVNILTFFVQNSIEEKMLILQRRKAVIIKAMMDETNNSDEDGGHSRAKSTLSQLSHEDIQFLFKK